MSRKTWIILGVIVALAAAGGAAWYFLSDDEMQTVGAPAGAYQPLPTDHTMGDAKARVVVIEYASPTCPICANFTINLFPKLKSGYIDTGKVFYVYRTFLRGPDDGSAEKLARCMPKDKYMAFNETLFRNQSKWDYEFGIPSPDGVHTALLALAQQSGMSAADADRCLASSADEAAISKVGEDAVAKYNVNATPTFVINGQAEAGFEDLFQRLDLAVGFKIALGDKPLAHWTGAAISAKKGGNSGGESPVSRKTLFIILGLVVLIAAAGIGYTYFGSSSDAVAANGPGYTLQPSDRTLGNSKSKVVLIEYAAPSCPVCANFNATSFPLLKAKYIDTGKVFYVFRVFPLRADDGSAEKIARCLPEDKYFAFIDLLFKNQPKWDVEYGVQEPEGVHQGLILLGRIAGMSAEQVDQCMVNKAEDDRINKVSSDGESRYSITGTPTFILDGVSIGSGNIPFDTMSKLLDASSPSSIRRAFCQGYNS